MGGAASSTAKEDPIGDAMRTDPDLSPDSFPKADGSTTTVSSSGSERVVGFAQYGARLDDCTDIMLFFHGTPGTRFFWTDAHSEHAARHGVNVVVPERPGFGLSTPDAGRTLLSTAEDAIHVLDIALQVPSDRRVHVLGYSAGGPNALAFAHNFPARCQSIALVSSLSPNRPGVLTGADAMSRVGYALAAHFPVGYLATLISSVVAPAVRKEVFEPRRDDFTDAENEVYSADESIRRCFAKSTLELYSRKGAPRAEALDYKLMARDWGFELSDIKLRDDCHLWVYSGAADVKVTPNMFHVLVNELSTENNKENMHPVLVDDETHLYFYKLFEQTLFSDLGITKTDSAS